MNKKQKIGEFIVMALFGFVASDMLSAYRANRPTIRQAEASVFPSFFQSAEKLIIFLFEFSLPGT